MRHSAKSKEQCALCLRKVGFGMTRSRRILVVGRATMHRYYRKHGIVTDQSRHGTELKGKGYRHQKRPKNHRAGIARIVRASVKRASRCLFTERRRPSLSWMEQYRTNPQFKIKHLLRKRVRKSIQEGYKSASTMALTGCTLAQLKHHLESQFMPGMSWQNLGVGHGHWNIDHKRPCASFDLTRAGDQRACFHHSNLQPLWAIDNMRKGARYEAIGSLP